MGGFPDSPRLRGPATSRPSGSAAPQARTTRRQKTSPRPAERPPGLLDTQPVAVVRYAGPCIECREPIPVGPYYTLVEGHELRENAPVGYPICVPCAIAVSGRPGYDPSVADESPRLLGVRLGILPGPQGGEGPQLDAP